MGRLPKNAEETKMNKTDIKSGIRSAIAIAQIGAEGVPRTNDEWMMRVREYFIVCEEEGLKPGYEGMCLACGCDRQYANRILRNQSRGYEALAWGKQVLASLMEQWNMTNKINPAQGIFLLKNHFGYQDNIKVQLDSDNNDYDRLDMDTIAKSLPKDLTVDVDFVEKNFDE